jgi:hypothetical protein
MVDQYAGDGCGQQRTDYDINRFKCVAVPEQIRANIVEATIVVGDDVEAGELLGDLSFELDDMGTVSGHGFNSLKARQRLSILNLQTVHRQGRIPSPDGGERGRLDSLRDGFRRVDDFALRAISRTTSIDRQLVSLALVNRKP